MILLLFNYLLVNPTFASSKKKPYVPGKQFRTVFVIKACQLDRADRSNPGAPICATIFKVLFAEAQGIVRDSSLSFHQGFIFPRNLLLR